MTSTGGARSVILLVGTPKWLAQVLELGGHVVVTVPAGAEIVQRCTQASPDVVVVQDVLPDMSGIDACRLLRTRRPDQHVPLLVLTADRPSPAQRVAGLRAGVWDFIWNPADRAEFLVKVEAHAQAKRSIEATPRHAGAPRHPIVGEAELLGSPWALVRRARDLGAVLMRGDAAMACVEFRLPPDVPQREAGRLLLRHARRSDLVGVWDPSGLTVIAPWVDQEKVFKLVVRVGFAFRAELTSRGYMVPGPGLPAGCDAVASLGATPLDPAELLQRAATALREGVPDPAYPWIRRFAPADDAGPESATTHAHALQHPGEG
jgi:CheY-like chemotaxis protein